MDEFLVSALMLLFASGLMFSEILWRGEGYRLWLGIALFVAWVIARKANVFTAT